MRKSRFLCLLPLMFTFSLCSCDLMSMMTPSARKRSSKEDSSEVINNKNSSNSSSKHIHYADKNASWSMDNYSHWHECADNDGGKVDKSSHKYGERYEVVDPTCTTSGSYKMTCSVCGFTKNVASSALGHDWQTVPINQDYNYCAPSYDQPGFQTQRCSRCQEERIIEIPCLERVYRIIDVSLTQDDNGVWAIISGECRGTGGAYMKMAFALEDYETGYFLTGKAEPSAEDFVWSVNYYQSINTESPDNFEAFINLTSLIPPDYDSKKGNYVIYFGPENFYSKINTYESYNSSEIFSDNSFKYNYRYNQQVGYLTLVVQKLQPYFHLSRVELYLKDVINSGNPNSQEIWVTIYGNALDQNKTVDQLLNEVTNVKPFIQFQSANNSYFRPEDADSYQTPGLVYLFSAGQLYSSGIKFVAIDICIQFMVEQSNTVYNTHLNLEEYKQEDCAMEAEACEIINIPGTNRYIEAFSYPTGPITTNNAYGNLGFRVYAEQ